MPRKKKKPLVVKPRSAYSIRPLVIRTLEQSGHYYEASKYQRETHGIDDLTVHYDRATAYIEWMEINQ